MRTIEIDLPRSFSVHTNTEVASYTVDVKTTLPGGVELTKRGWVTRAKHVGSTVWIAGISQHSVDIDAALLTKENTHFLGWQQTREGAEELVVQWAIEELRKQIVKELSS